MLPSAAKRRQMLAPGASRGRWAIQSDRVSRSGPPMRSADEVCRSGAARVERGDEGVDIGEIDVSERKSLFVFVRQSTKRSILHTTRHSGGTHIDNVPFTEHRDVFLAQTLQMI